MGIYGKDLNAADKANEKARSEWVFAEVTAGFSFLAAVVFAVPAIRRMGLPLFGVDVVLFIFWTALFGVFAKMWMKEDCMGTNGCGRMKTGMWFDLVGMLLWLVSAVVMAIIWRRNSHGRSTFTGRAAVV